jgi:hypothetical protein
MFNTSRALQWVSECGMIADERIQKYENIYDLIVHGCRFSTSKSTIEITKFLIITSKKGYDT